MKTYDWIVVGGGITGAALGYELAKQGLQVLLLEQHTNLQGASRHSYGGLAYWSGATPLTRQLAKEGIDRHGHLSAELEADTQLRELTLLLTIDPESDPQIVAQEYQKFAIAPQLLTPEETHAQEPLINPHAISGALQLPHGHINPLLTTLAYTKAMERLGGTVHYEQVLSLISRREEHISGVSTAQADYHASGVVVCAGGLSRSLLKAAGFSVPLYFTHAESIEIPPVDFTFQSIVMPANLQRSKMEGFASAKTQDQLWEGEHYELAPPIMDAGMIQFQDQSLRLGQISRVLSDPHASIDPATSEAEIRHRIKEIFPSLADLSGTWNHCLVTFCRDYLPLVGSIPEANGLYIFSGFSNPLVFIPALAQRFAAYLSSNSGNSSNSSNSSNSGNDDDIIQQLSPSRFMK